MNAAMRVFEIEINRDGLRSYMRAQSLIIWGGVVGVFVGFYLLIGFVELLEDGLKWMEVVLWLGHGLAVYVLIVAAAYFVFGHFSSKGYAKSIRARVDGPYFVIRTGDKCRTERKVHFRAITDFYSSQSPLMKRFGIEAVGVNIAGPVQGKSTVIHGVINADEVRDLLCQVDAEREGYNS